MLFEEPARSKYDLSFNLGRMPVRVHPAFWIITVLFAIGGPSTPTTILVWVGAIFVSILVHELGHALLMRRYGLSPHIVLHGMGGLAAADFGLRSQSRRERILIALAGPGAGFLFALLLVGLVLGLGYRTHLLGLAIGNGAALPSPTLQLVIADLLYINAGWGLVNLIPVHPLDGAHVAEELLRSRDPERGTRNSLWVSVVAGAIMVVVGLFVLDSPFVAFLFGYLAYLSFVAIQRHRGLPPPSASKGWKRLRERLRRTRRKVELRVVETAAKQSIESQARMEEKAASKPEIKAEAEEMLRSLSEEARRVRKPSSKIGHGREED